MEIVSPSVKIETKIDADGFYKDIELFGRTAYKSEKRIAEGSAEKFIRMLIKRGHESVLEHKSITVRFICDRGVSHQLVRHRLATYTQESSRYVSSNPMQVVEPLCVKKDLAAKIRWKNLMMECERVYEQLRTDHGFSPEEARCVLPGFALKTEVVTTMNLREWRHVINIRTAPDAHPHIRALFVDLLKQLKEIIPVFFEDLEVE